MKDNDVLVDKACVELYNERADRIHLIKEIDIHGIPLQWTGRLLGVIGKNLLFEKRNGQRILVDPEAVREIIEMRRD